MKKNLMLLLLLGMSHLMFAQVDKVSYSMEYNSETCLFDYYLHVNSGNTRIVRDRVQLGAQVTVIAPKGSYVKIEESYNPLIGNLELRGVTPIKWDVTSLVENKVSGDGFFSIAPAETPTSFYNNLRVNDKVKLFSLNITPVVNCAKDVRIYENGVDPSSSAPGMLGSDFSNGFTMGGIHQLYEGNNPSIYPESPVINGINISRANNITVNAKVSQQGKSACQNVLDYKWYSPKGLISSSNEFPALSMKDVMKGDYKLVVTDEMGCKDEKIFNLSDTEVEEVLSNVDDLNGKIISSSIYPNPSTNIVNLLIEGEVGTRVNASIYSVNGSVLMSNVLNEKLTSDSQEFKIITGLKTGIYNIGLQSDNGKKIYHKLIIVD